jgi:hypothetical protein
MKIFEFDEVVNGTRFSNHKEDTMDSKTLDNVLNMIPGLDDATKNMIRNSIRGLVDGLSCSKGLELNIGMELKDGILTLKANSESSTDINKLAGFTVKYIKEAIELFNIKDDTPAPACDSCEGCDIEPEDVCPSCPEETVKCLYKDDVECKDITECAVCANSPDDPHAEEEEEKAEWLEKDNVGIHNILGKDEHYHDQDENHKDQG